MARGNLALRVVLLAVVVGSMAFKTSRAAAAQSSSGSVERRPQPTPATTAGPSPSGYAAIEILKEFLFGQDMQAPSGQDGNRHLPE